MDASKEDKRLILICVDGSAHSIKALNWYHDTMFRKGDEIGLVHVHSIPPHPAFIGGGIAAYSMHKTSLIKSLKESHEVVDRFKKLCEEKNLPTKVYMETMKHSVGETICEVARKNEADQIITGKRGLGVVRRTLIGSVSDYILHHAAIPTTIVAPALHEDEQK